MTISQFGTSKRIDVAARESTQRTQCSRSANVGSSERIASIAAGTAIALLGLSRRSIGGVLVAGLGAPLIYRGVSGFCGLYSALGVNRASDEAEPKDYFERGIHVEVTHTISKPAAELYEFWKNFENLPRFMNHLQSVQVLDGKRSHWVAKAPKIAGGAVEWDAEIINDEPNSVIAWKSLPGAGVDNAGSVRFVAAPGDRGTEVHVVLDYIPPAGTVGKWVAKFYGEDPQSQIKEDLRNFKRLMETGEIATIQNQPKGNCSGGGTLHSGI